MSNSRWTNDCDRKRGDIKGVSRRQKSVEANKKDTGRKSLASLYLRSMLVCSLLHGIVESFVHVPNRHTVASIPGDLVIGILIPVHERPSSKQAQTRTCGTVREQYGIQRVEAAFRTIDSINADPTILPNITLGIEIRDSCWFSPIALEQSIEFIRDAMAASEQSSSIGTSVTSRHQANESIGQQISTALISSGSLANQMAPPICVPFLARQPSSKRVKNVVGVIGPGSSSDTVQVQNLLQLFNMPQVGYSATSRDLSNKNFFKYFLRVVPSDKLQAQVMIDLMLAHNWTYVTVVYTEGNYGSSLMNAFRERAKEVGICLATLESMPTNADETKVEQLIVAIERHPTARIVVCMCEGRTVSKLFDGFKRQSLLNKYLVVGSDGWSDRQDVVQGHEEFALGAISVRIYSAYVDDFDRYYFQLMPHNNTRNPWFAEFWEHRFQCNLDTTLGSQQQSIRSTSAGSTKIYNRTCTGRESLKMNHKQDSKMAFVQMAIITMALGLDRMQRSTCPANKVGLCPEMLPVNGSVLLQHLMNVSFSFLNEVVYFDELGDPPGKYEILNFRRRERRMDSNEKHNSEENDERSDFTKVTLDFSGLSAVNESKSWPTNSYATLRVNRTGWPRGREQQYNQFAPKSVLQRGLKLPEQSRSPLLWRASRAVSNVAAPLAPASGGASNEETETEYEYEYAIVGSWSSNKKLNLHTPIKWPAFPSDAPGTPPRSVCSLPCAKGQAKRIQSDSVKCCWICVACRPNEYLLDEYKCQACEKGWWPNQDKTTCDQIPIQYLDWRSFEALGALSIAIFGFILTLATAIVFIRHNDTPVVKSSTRELSYMILFAMFLCYSNTFVLVARPRKFTCLASRILPGFSFALLYGALVTKTNRIARILAGSKKKIITRRPRFMSATSQVAITWIIVGIECLMIALMLIKEPADQKLDYPSDERVFLVCNTTTLGILVPLGFDFFLIAMCTWYAFKTRNVPENFNEAKFIGFTMYTTLVIWIAFVAIYLSNENHKVTTLCLCISFSALFALFLLFFPKCYIIIFKPEKNNRSFFTTTKNVRCHIGLHAPNTATPSIAANQHQAAAHGNGNCFTISGQVQALDQTLEQTRALGQHQHQQSPIGAPENQQQQQSGSGNFLLHQLKLNQKQIQLQLQQPLESVEKQRGRNVRSQPARLSQLNQASSARELDRGENGFDPSVRRADSSSSSSILDHIQSILRGSAVRGAKTSRKGSARAASIQQHLMAVRYAENLDRQTNFRRSQVQRQVHRFEPQQASSSDLSGAIRPDQSCSTIASLAFDRDATEQLLILLEQLIGSQNVGRLIQLLIKFNDEQQQQQQQQQQHQQEDDRSVVLRPLDLDKIAHRKLALAILKFLQDSIEIAIDELIRRDSILYRSISKSPAQSGSIDLSSGVRSSRPRIEFCLRKSETSGNLEASLRRSQKDLNLIGRNEEPIGQLTSDTKADESSVWAWPEDPIERILNCILGLNEALPGAKGSGSESCKVALEQPPGPLEATNASQMKSHCRSLHSLERDKTRTRRSRGKANEMDLQVDWSSEPEESKIEETRIELKPNISSGATIERKLVARPSEGLDIDDESGKFLLIREDREAEEAETADSGTTSAKVTGKGAAPIKCCCCTRKRRLLRHQKRQARRAELDACGQLGSEGCLECQKASKRRK